MSPDVDRDHPRELSDLRGGQPDAALEGAHRVQQVPADGLDVGRLRRRRHLLQHRVRVDEDLASGQAGNASERLGRERPHAHLDLRLVCDLAQRRLHVGLGGLADARPP